MNNKDIKNFLHLYIGRQIQYIGDDRTFLNKGQIETLTHENIALWSKNAEWIKLLLRPLSSITQMEFSAALVMVYRNIFGYMADTTDHKIIVDDSDSVGLKCVDRMDGKPMGLTIERSRGVEFSHNSDKLLVNQFEMVAWLLKNGFDLFGLIESGVAIDAAVTKE